MPETPIGESAVSAGQARRPAPQEGVPTNPDTGEPVVGATPVGESVQTAPPAPEPDTPEAIRTRRLGSARNLALLARQAIGNGYDTMQVDPKMLADLCTVVEEIDGGSNEPTLAPAATAADDPTAAPAADDARTINALRGPAQSQAAMVGKPVSIWINDGSGESQLVHADQENPGEGWRRAYTAEPPEAPPADAPEAGTAEPFTGPGQASS